MSVAARGPHASLRGVTRVYPAVEDHPPVHALGPVDLDLRPGEFFSVVGPVRLREIHSSGCPRGARPGECWYRRLRGAGRGGRGPGGDRGSLPGRRKFSLAHRVGQRRLRAAPRRRVRVSGARTRRPYLVVHGARGLRFGLPGAALRRHAPAPMHRSHARDAPSPAPTR